MEAAEAYPAACAQCGGPLAERVVQVALWREQGLVVIDQVPARVCGGCSEQFYDDATVSGLRRLIASNFPERARVGEITVPLYRLTPENPAL